MSNLSERSPAASGATRSKLTSLRRPYRGSSPDDRIADRRARLLRAAVEVYGEAGFRKATVQKVCDAAGLTKRYFYESFSDPAALLAAAFRQVNHEFLDDLRVAAAGESRPGAAKSRAILTTFFTVLKDEPQQSRLFLLETRGVSSEVDEVMAQARRDTVELIAPRKPGSESRAAALQRLGAGAGLVEISVEWIQGGYAHAVGDLVDAAYGLFHGIIDDCR